MRRPRKAAPSTTVLIERLRRKRVRYLATAPANAMTQVAAFACHAKSEIASVCRSAVAAMAPAGTRATNGDPDGSEGLLGRGDKRATAQSGRIAEEAV